MGGKFQIFHQKIFIKTKWTGIHPGKTNILHLKVDPWKRRCLLVIIIFGFHVNFQGWWVGPPGRSAVSLSMAEPQHPMAGYAGKGNKKRTFSYHQKKSLRIKSLQSSEKVFPPGKSQKSVIEKSFEKTLWGATLRMSSLCKARLHSKSQHMLFATCYIVVSCCFFEKSQLCSY